jgi:hypothetical protein
MNTKTHKKMMRVFRTVANTDLGSYSGATECSLLMECIPTKDPVQFCHLMTEMQFEWLNNILIAIANNKKDAWMFLEKYLCINSLIVSFHTIKSGATAQQAAAHLVYLLSKGYEPFATLYYNQLISFFKKKRSDILAPNLINFAIASYNMYHKLNAKKGKGILAELLLNFNTLDNDSPLIDTLVEYHINNMGINELDEIEFLDLDFIPIEFMMVNALRQKENLPALTKPFELLSTPFSNVPTEQCFDPLNDKDILAMQNFLTSNGIE